MPGTESQSRLYVWIQALSLFVITTCVYVPALHGGFIWDDDAYVTENLLLRDFNGLMHIWFSPGATLQYYPLTFTTFWLEFQSWRLWSPGYHLVNILLHAGNALLLWRLLRMLTVPGAWFVAALFALHPVHVESTAWIAERKNVLSGLFYLSSLICYLRFSLLHMQSVEGNVRNRRQYYYALLFFLAALLSKTSTCTLPAVILFIGWWKKDWEVNRELPYLLPLFAISALFGLITAGVERNVVGAVGEQWNLSLVERSLIAGRALWFYVGKLLWPFNLTFLYPKWNIDVTVWWQWLFPVSVMILLAVVTCFCERVGKTALVVILFFIGTLFPVLGFFDVYFTLYSYVADHFQYLASIGPLALFGGRLWKAQQLPHEEKKDVSGPLLLLAKKKISEHFFRTIVSFSILVLLGWLTWQQGHIYESRRSLSMDTIEKNPLAWAAYNDLAMSAVHDGSYPLALEYLEKAVGLHPKGESIHNNLCMVHWKLGDVASALRHGQESVLLQPNRSKAQICLGFALLATGALHEAEGAFIRAITLNPDLALPYYGLGAMYLKERTIFPHVTPQQAIRYLERALVLFPGSDPSLFLAAQMLATYPDAAVRNGQRALQLAQELCQRTNNSNSRSLDVLAAAYAEDNQFDRAIEVTKRALTLVKKQDEDQLFNQLQERLQLYERKIPYRLQPEQIRIEPQIG